MNKQDKKQDSKELINLIEQIQSHNMYCTKKDSNVQIPTQQSIKSINKGRLHRFFDNFKKIF
jgi:hypothetical protein